MIKSLLYQATLQLDQALTHVPSIGRFRPLKGTFSAAERVRNGELAGEILMESQEPGPCPPGSITELAGMQQHSHQPWPVFWARSDDARLVGSMQLWRDSHDLLSIEGVFHRPKRLKIRDDRYLAQILVPEPQILPGAWTSLGSNWGNGKNYFHWFLDTLTRLSVRDHLPEPTRILLPANAPTFVTQTLEMLGLSDISETVHSPCLQPERFYFCSPTAMTGVWNPIGFNWLRSQFARFISPQADGLPLFLTRRGIARIPPNLPEIEALFTKNGFKIIDCGDYSVQEQIRMISAAPAIAGLHGAAMTNLLWARPNTPAIELFACGYLNACYEQIAFQGCLNYNAGVLDAINDISTLNDWCRKLNHHSKN